MDYKELLGDREFNSPEEICEWMDSAATAITYLLARAEAVEARAEKAERERDGFKQRYIEMTNRACELSKIVDEHGWEE